MLIPFPRKKKPTPAEVQSAAQRLRRSNTWFAIAIATLAPALAFVPLLFGVFDPGEIDFAKTALLYGIVSAGIYAILH